MSSTKCQSIRPGTGATPWHSCTDSRLADPIAACAQRLCWIRTELDWGTISDRLKADTYARTRTRTSTRWMANPTLVDGRWCAETLETFLYGAFRVERIGIKPGRDLPAGTEVSGQEYRGAHAILAHRGSACWLRSGESRIGQGTLDPVLVWISLASVALAPLAMRAVRHRPVCCR